MIKNVNLMQNENDFAWDRYSEEYIIQALANLGQRIGIKGDSIAYKSFTFNDILDKNSSYDADTYIGYIEYIKNNENVIDEIEASKYKANFGIAEKENLDNIVNIDTTLSINDILYFPQELSFTVNINNIEKYSKNSICVNKDNELTYILAGKLIGYDDKDADNTVLLYEKFDKTTNKLKYSAKLFKFDNNYPGDYCCLINVKNETYDQKSLSNKYIMTIYLFDITKLNDERLIENFNDIFCFNNYNDPDQLPFNLLNSNFVNISLLEYYNDNENRYYESNSPISIILNNKENLYTHSSHSILLMYDTETNQLLAQDQINYQSVIDLYNNEYMLNLDEELFMINNDINYLYFNIFNYYNEKFYLNDRSLFIKRILAKIYEALSNYDYANSYRLYIPLDYEFHYICNKNNEMEIYYSNNIYVTLTSLKSIYLDEFWKNNKNLIYDYNGISKIKVYNFEIQYNYANEPPIINSVYIKDIYTMPYINANDNWSINDIDTKIKATGDDAGNPNIIIIYNKDKSNDTNRSFEILNAISNKEHIEGADYKQKWFNVNNALFDNIYTDKIRCCAYIPVIDEYNLKYFKDSIILSISDLNCLEYDDYKYNYKGSYILTMWHLKETNGNVSYEYIKHIDTEYALALGSTVNLLNETSDESIANLNAQDLILLKSILTTVGQERLAINNNNWLIIKNKQSEEYYESTNKDNTYNNDLNAIIQYNDTIAIQSNHIIHSQNNKYVNDISKLSITNSLYPKYVVSTYTDSGQEVVKRLKKLENNVVNTVRESRVTVKGQQITNIESLLEELNSGTIEVEELKSVTIEKAEKINSNYNEYIFNSNIPTIDFKEVFNRNLNVLNRVNVVSLDNNGKLYNAYIGTSYDEANKNTLHIGTSKTNINIGTDTLFNEIDKSNFNTHNTLSLDFDNIILNSKKKLSLKTNPLYQYNNGSITYNMVDVKLIGTYMTSYVPNNVINSSNFININEWNNYSTELFAKDLSNTTTYLSINNIMKTNFDINLKDYNGHITINNNGTNNQIVKFGRTSLNDTIYLYKVPTDITVYNNIQNAVVYIPSILSVMYYTIMQAENNNLINTINIYISFNK